MNRLKIYLEIVLALIFMSSCGSSAKLAKNHDEMKSDSRISDYLNISKRERALVDSIVALNEYAVFLDSFQKYLTKKNAMRKGDNCIFCKPSVWFRIAVHCRGCDGNPDRSGRSCSGRWF